MKISLKFLQIRLKAAGTEAELLLNNLYNPTFDTCLFFTGQFAQEGTLYFCPPDAQRDVFHGMSPEQNIGIVWTSDTLEPPRHLPILRLRQVTDIFGAMNEISGILAFYRQWGEKVMRYVLEQRSLPEIFELLSEVTPNPWYLSDSSFRMQVICKSPDMEEMSPIWRYQYRQGHLPIQIILGIEENGLLDLMNKMRQAFIVSEPEPFGFTFVSKTITYSNNILGHFYILGVYTQLSEYEMEIAEFFGNVLTELLKRDSSYLPTLGRFYDNYFIDLIEGIDPENLDMLDQVFQKISWNTNSTFYLAVLKQNNGITRAKSTINLEIQMLESKISCKAFLYREELVVLINCDKLDNRLMLSPCELAEERIRSVLQDFGGSAGISEGFSDRECFERLTYYYQQGCTALQFALEQEAPVSVCRYSCIAVNHLCRELGKTSLTELFAHPAVSILQKYDAEHKTELAQTLYQYLICGENIVHTAKKLYIHRNSLMYRMDKLQQLTGIDLSNIQEKVRLFLTFHLYDKKIP